MSDWVDTVERCDKCSGVGRIMKEVEVVGGRYSVTCPDCEGRGYKLKETSK